MSLSIKEVEICSVFFMFLFKNQFKFSIFFFCDDKDNNKKKQTKETVCIRARNNNNKVTTQTVRREREHHGIVTSKREREREKKQAHITMDLQTTETDSRGFSQTKWMLSSLSNEEIKRKDSMYKE